MKLYFDETIQNPAKSIFDEVLMKILGLPQYPSLKETQTRGLESMNSFPKPLENALE